MTNGNASITSLQALADEDDHLLLDSMVRYLVAQALQLPCWGLQASSVLLTGTAAHMLWLSWDCILHQLKLD